MDELSEGIVNDDYDPESGFVEHMSPTTEYMPSILEDEEYHETEADMERRIQEDFQYVQSRLRRQTTETLIENLATIAPTVASVSSFESSNIEIAILSADGTSRKTSMNIRSLLHEVNSVGTKYETKYYSDKRGGEFDLPKSPHGDGSNNNNSNKSQSNNNSKKLFPPSGSRARRGSVSGGGSEYRDAIPELKLRDLRRLDSQWMDHHEEPYILVRRHCVLLSLGRHTRAIIQAERVLLLVSSDENDDNDHDQDNDDGDDDDGSNNGSATGGVVGNGGNGKRILDLLEEVVKKLLHSDQPEIFRRRSFSNGLAMLAKAAATTSASGKVAAPSPTAGTSTGFDDNCSVTSTADVNNNNNFNSSTNEVTIPFESRAYGVFFSVSHSLLVKDLNTLSVQSHRMITAIGKHTILSVRLQELMYATKDKVGDLLSRVRACRQLISDILQEDDELQFLNLQVLKTDPTLYTLPPSEASQALYTRYGDLEPLFELIELDFRGVENQADKLLKRLKNTEQSVNLRLDTSRNELLYATTILSVFASTIGFGSYIAGVFGMNLDNVQYIQPVKGTFWGVFLSSFVLLVVAAVAIIAVFSQYHILPSHAHIPKMQPLRRFDGHRLRYMYNLLISSGANNNNNKNKNSKTAGQKRSNFSWAHFGSGRKQQSQQQTQTQQSQSPPRKKSLDRNDNTTSTPTGVRRTSSKDSNGSRNSSSHYSTGVRTEENSVTKRPFV